MPAGNVTAVLSAGTLAIVATDLLTPQAVLDGLNNQDISVVGNGAGNFTVSGNNNTTVNGLIDVQFANVTNIRIDMRLGNDKAVVLAANLPGTLTFLGGDGNNTLTVDGNEGAQTFGAITVNNGDGNDTLQIISGITTIKGALIINNGVGDSDVTLNRAASADELTAGGISLLNGDGRDEFHVFGNRLTVTGTMTIDHGTSAFTDTDITAKTISLGGLLSVNNLDGTDNFKLGAAGGTVSGRPQHLALTTQEPLS